MEKITKTEATKIATQLIEKYGIGGNSKTYGNISSSFPTYYTKATLVNEIYTNGTNNIWFPLERNVTFDNVEDNTILSVCKPTGTITMTEKFYGNYSIDELLSFDFTNLYNHCLGSSNSMTVEAGFGDANDYTVQYWGTSEDGINFSANVTYNTVNYSKKNYDITKTWTDAKSKKEYKTTDKIYSNGQYWSSQDSVQTQNASYKDKKYTINQVESKVTGSNGKTKYLTTETVSDGKYKTLSNTSFEYDNQNYSGTPVRVASEDVTTNSIYVEEYGKIKTAKGDMVLKCTYNDAGEIIIEKPTLSNGIVKTAKSSNDKNCIGTISVQNSTVKNTSQTIITPNEASIRSPQDFVKVTEKLKTIVASGNNEIVVCKPTVGTKKTDRTADTEDNKYVSTEDYFSDILQKK